MSIPPAIISPITALFYLLDRQDRANFSGSNCGVVKHGRDHIYPVKPLCRDLYHIIEDDRFETFAKKDQSHDEQVHFSGPNNNLPDCLPLEVAFGHPSAGAASFVQDKPDNSQNDDCRYDIDAKVTEEEIETGIMRGTGKLGNHNSGEGFSERC